MYKMIVVISNPTPVKGEHEIIHQLFEESLDIFHINKPLFSKEQTEKFIWQISPEYHSRITLHSQHFKFHSLIEIEECKENYDYAFLSPIFDSISKAGYKSKFDLKELKGFLKNRKEKIIALGGINEDKIGTVKDMGFSGIGLVGAIWQSGKPVLKFKQIKEKWMKGEFAY